MTEVEETKSHLDPNAYPHGELAVRGCDCKDCRAARLDDEDQCELYVDLDERCPNRATQIIAEPVTPSEFEKRVCGSCGERRINAGWIPKGAIER